MKTLLELMKVRITVAVTFTTAVGYVLARGRIDAGLLMPLFRAARHDLTGWLIALSAALLIGLAARWLAAGFRKVPTETAAGETGGRIFIRCFMAINSYALFVMLALIVDRVV